MNRKKYEILIIRVEETEHNYKYIRTDELNGEYTDMNNDGIQIKINYNVKDLYEIPQGFSGMYNFYRYGIIRRYLVLVNKDGSIITETPPKITGNVLKVARDWKGLGNAIKSAFGKPGLPKVLMIVVIAVAIIILLILMKSGYLQLPSGG